jgi:hypothetical protein
MRSASRVLAAKSDPATVSQTVMDDRPTWFLIACFCALVVAVVYLANWLAR